MIHHHASSTTFPLHILDFGGFEMLRVNSLEQLLINYTEERMQQRGDLRGQRGDGE